MTGIQPASVKTFQVPGLITENNLGYLVDFIDTIPYEFENMTVEFYASSSLFSDPANSLARMPVRIFFEVGQMLERKASAYRPIDWEIQGRSQGQYVVSFLCRPIHFMDLVKSPG